jgi:hypothetical protein
MHAMMINTHMTKEKKKKNEQKKKENKFNFEKEDV